MLKKTNNPKNNKKNLSICGINNASLSYPTKEFHLGVKVANNIKNKLKNTTELGIISNKKIIYYRKTIKNY